MVADGLWTVRTGVKKWVLPDGRDDLVKVRLFAENPAVLMAVPVAVMKSEGQKVKLTTDFAVEKRRHK